MKTVLIGSGNVASHLGKALIKSGHAVVQIYSRRLEHAQELATALAEGSAEDTEKDLAEGSAENRLTIPIDRLDRLDREADIYFICVSDQAIAEVIAQLPAGLKGVVVHTSGSTSISVFADAGASDEGAASVETGSGGYQGRHGVFYPVQTFSKAKAIDFKNIPLALEASDPDTYQLLSRIAAGLSERVFPCDSTQREAIHIAAVFACNFSNYLYSVADRILQQHGLDFELIRPLILETAEKAQLFAPASVQTGPAVRKDLKIVQQHLDFLDREKLADPRIRQLYALISEILAGR